MIKRALFLVITILSLSPRKIVFRCYSKPAMHLASLLCKMYLESFGHAWKVKQMVHLEHSDTRARSHTHTHTKTFTTHTKSSPERGAPLYLPSSLLLCCSLFLLSSPDAVVCIIFMPAHLWTRTPLVSPF